MPPIYTKIDDISRERSQMITNWNDMEKEKEREKRAKKKKKCEKK